MRTTQPSTVLQPIGFVERASPYSVKTCMSKVFLAAYIWRVADASLNARIFLEQKLKKRNTAPGRHDGTHTRQEI